MYDARKVLKSANYYGSKLEIEAAYDITRTELISTTLQKPMDEDDD